MVEIHTDENHRQAITDDIIQIHNVMCTVFPFGQFHKTAELLYRHFDKRIFFFGLFRVIMPACHFHGQVNRVIRLVGQSLGLRKPNRVGEAGQLIAEIGTDECLLRFGQLFFSEHAYFFLGQFFRQLLHHVLKLPVVAVIQPVDFLYRLSGLLALRLHLLHATFGNPCLRGHPHPEKLIQVVAVNPHEAETFQQRHVLVLGFLQDAVIEIHPADISRNHRQRHSHRLLHLHNA